MTCHWMSSNNSDSGAVAPPVTLNTATRPEWRPRQGLWVKGSPTASAWPWPKPSSPSALTGPDTSSSTITPMPASEAASLAGHLQLGKLIYLYDDNGISIDGSTDQTFTENVGKRFEGYGWHVQEIADGNDLPAIEASLKAAQAESTRPSLVIVHTHIAYGSPGKQDTAEAHGAPLGAEEVGRTKEFFGWPQEPTFYLPGEALAHFRQALKRGQSWDAEWQTRFASYASAYPDLAAEWQRALRHELPPGWDASVPTFKASDGAMATRVASGRGLHAHPPKNPHLLGG